METIQMKSSDLSQMQQLGFGACSTVYKYGNDLVIKVLKEKGLELHDEDEFSHLIGIENPTCVFPKARVEIDGKFAGYAMDYVQGKHLQDSIGNIDIQTMIEAIRKVEGDLTLLASDKVLFQDLNQGGIMWDEEEQCIKIIDTDFFQRNYDVSEKECYSANIESFNTILEMELGILNGQGTRLSEYLMSKPEFSALYNKYMISSLRGENISVTELLVRAVEIFEEEFGVKVKTISEMSALLEERGKTLETQESLGEIPIFTPPSNERKEGETKDMKNFINANFTYNDYFLMGNLLAYSYRFKKTLSLEGEGEFQSMEGEERERLLAEFREFIQKAKSLPAVQAFVNYGADFDKQADVNEFATNMSKRLAKLSTVKSDEELAEKENSDVTKAFRTLMDTSFYQSFLAKAKEHGEKLQGKLEAAQQTANNAVQTIYRNLDEKEIDILVLPPEFFDDPYALNTQGKHVSTVASYPDSFNRNIPVLDVIAMLHEIAHTYIPISNDMKFSNDMQGEVYKVINHCLVELSSNGELGVQVAGLKDYFSTPMHHEILMKDGKPIKREEYIRNGIAFLDEYEFESRTEGFKGDIVTQSDELSNDKIRGIVYPYFLAFKNMNSENPLQMIASEMERDREALTSIYGEEFFERISNPEYLQGILGLVRDTESIVELNDTVARDAFGIERTKTITPKRLGTIALTGENAVNGVQMRDSEERVKADTKELTNARGAESQNVSR